MRRGGRESVVLRFLFLGERSCSLARRFLRRRALRCEGIALG